MAISEKERYEIHRDYIKHEDSLINNRLTWLLVVQGLIFSAYSGLTTTMVNIYAGCDKNCLTNLDSQLSSIQRLLSTLAWVGLLVGIAGLFGIIAAMATIDKLSSVSFPADFPNLTGGGNRTAKLFGRLTPLAIPLIIIGAWLFLAFSS